MLTELGEKSKWRFSFSYLSATKDSNADLLHGFCWVVEGRHSGPISRDILCKKKIDTHFDCATSFSPVVMPTLEPDGATAPRTKSRVIASSKKLLLNTIFSILGIKNKHWEIHLEDFSDKNFFLFIDLKLKMSSPPPSPEIRWKIKYFLANFN